MSIAVVGGGPAGLMAAEAIVDAEGPGEIDVVVYDRMPSLARKLLIAGRGGLNLTHSDGLGGDLGAFLARYDRSGARPPVADAIRAFPPAALVAWSQELGQETFVGSSGRVFPRSMKASPLLRAWLRRLDALGVTLRLRMDWTGFEGPSANRFRGADGSEEVIAADATLLATGGASWPRLGSDGSFAPILTAAGVAVTPLRAANSGFAVAWSESFRSRFAGEPLKNIAITFGGNSVRGEAMVTEYGLEGGAIYALSAPLREAVALDGSAVVTLDLLPQRSAEAIAERLARQRPSESLANRLRKATQLAPVAINLMREAVRDLPRDHAALAALIKSVPLTLGEPSGLARAISTAGGVSRDAVDDTLMLTARPGTFVAGEMLDWEAPTGGYLLQAVMATGVAAAAGIATRLGLPAKQG